MIDELLNKVVDALSCAAAQRGFEVQRNPIELTKLSYRRDEIAYHLMGTEVEDLSAKYECVGLKAGPYNLLISTMGQRLEWFDARFSEMRSRAAIARSWLGQIHEVDLSTISIGRIGSESEADWREVSQKIERDESICRKFVWLPPSAPEDLEASLSRFIQRTPLASPWTGLADTSEQNLDAVDYLVRTLGSGFEDECSLPASVLRRWLQLLEQDDGSAVQLVPDLIATVSEANEDD